jgi:methylmalonyl-CoA mutase C-terminal domain/subunit
VSLKGKRILIAKPGLDGHDVGAKIIALALRDAGADVIYTGLRKSPEYIARIAVDEDVDAVGLSILSGSHNELVAETIKLLREMDADDVKIFVGGTVSGDDVQKLKVAGVAGVFTSEMKIEDTLAELSDVLG